MRLRAAAFDSWAGTADRTERTRPAREGFLRRFEDEVDPTHSMPPAVRQKAAESRRKAYFTRLALASSKARGKKRAA
jgi:hypothetical protein